MKIKVGNGNKEMVLLFLVIAAELAASLVTLALVQHQAVSLYLYSGSALGGIQGSSVVVCFCWSLRIFVNTIIL